MSKSNRQTNMQLSAETKSKKQHNLSNCSLPKNIAKNITLLLQENKITEATKQISELKKDYANSPILWQLDALACNKNKDFFGALRGFQKVVSLDSGVASHYSNLGLAFENYGEINKAIENYAKAIEIDPNSYITFHNMAVALDKTGDLKGAIENFKYALKIKPEFPEALNNMGALLKKVNRNQEALKCFNLALKYKANYTEALYHIALIYKQEKKIEKAANIFYELSSKFPTNIYYKLNYGLCLSDQRNFSAAIDLFRKIINESPDCGEAYLALGSVQRQLGNISEAIQLFETAILKNSKLEEAHGLLAVCLNQQGNKDAAKTAYEEGLSINPNSLSILTNFGHFHHENNDFDKAFEVYFKAHQLSIPNTEMVHNMYYAVSCMCDWVQTNVLENMYQNVGASNGYSNPFVMLQFEDNPRNQYLRSLKHGKLFFHGKNHFVANNFNKNKSQKIKIGYFSADFHNHATMRLMSGMFRHHDKTKYSIHTFMYGKSSHDDQTSIARQYSDEFFDISMQSDKEIIEAVKKLDLDIAIDLKGYTKETRSQLFSHRLAPIQINFLGYPSTMGVEFIDYIIADKTLIPETSKKYYSEKIIYMPDTYQPNDNTRQIAATKMTRKTLGVAEDAFLMCCMNNNYKVTRFEFEIWLRILGKVENSVLVFLATNKFAVNNIREAAKKRGIEKNRILFVPKLGYSEHLERLALFDLFLDTFRINGHTTTSDALWSGLPVVTKIGNQFAARVSASLLYAANLPELVTETNEEYEALILELATNPKKLATVRQKLKNNRAKMPLFDTEKYTKSFETALSIAHQRHIDNSPLSDIIF